MRPGWAWSAASAGVWALSFAKPDLASNDQCKANAEVWPPFRMRCPRRHHRDVASPGSSPSTPTSHSPPTNNTPTRVADDGGAVARRPRNRPHTRTHTRASRWGVLNRLCTKLCTVPCNPQLGIRRSSARPTQKIHRRLGCDAPGTATEMWPALGPLRPLLHRILCPQAGVAARMVRRFGISCRRR